MTENEKLSSLRQRSLAQRRTDSADTVVELLPTEVEAHESLRAYWDILYKHRWEVIACVLVTLTIALIYSFKMKPVYKATAAIEIESETPLVQSVKDIYDNLPTDEAFLQTQVKVIDSDNLAWATIQQLRLPENPAFNSAIGKEQPVDPRVARDQYTKQFKNALGVTWVRSTHIVEVSYESTDPDLAANVADSLVHNYIEYNFQKKYDATRQASAWIQQQLDELKAKVEKSQQALVNYERAHSIVNVSEKQSAVEQTLSDLSRDLTNAQSDRAQKESLYEMVKSNPTQVALLAQNELLQRLEEKFADLKGQYVDALGQYGANFPKVVRMRDQVNEIQSLIDKERKNVIDRTRDSYIAAVNRENLVAASVAKQKVEVSNLNQSLIEQNMLSREFETNQQLYNNLLQRLKDADVSAGLKATNIHLVDSALPPTVPVRPKKLLNISVGFAIGLLLGVSLAFLLEGLQHSTIKSAEDVEGLVGATCLALIPLARLSQAPAYGLLGRGTPRPAPNGPAALTVLKDPTSPVAESYRALRSAILFSTAAQPPQVMVVTSAQPNEGKTSTSLNLAAVLAQNGARVVMIDGDMRNPGLARALDLINSKGLSGVLTGAYRVDEALQKVDTSTELWVLPAGPHPPNPAELLSSPSMDSVMKELRQTFDHIVIDSPPLLMVTDATILSTMAAGVILVAESGVTAPAALVRAHRTLVLAGSRVLGVVINKVDPRKNGYYYGNYTKYYGAYYGAAEKEHASAKS